MKNYILYGAASIGNLAKESLERCGLQIVGYIDKRAFELSVYNGLPVWGIDNVPERYRNKDTVIYLSVKNVFEHESIAAALLEEGFQYIIYKPYSVLLGYGSKEECQLAQLYDDLFSGDVSRNFWIPEVSYDVKIHDFAKIKEEDNMVTAYIPTEFIFTNNYRNSEMEKWGDVCILAFFTHLDFFRFLDNQKSGEINTYLQEYCIFTANLQGKIKVTDAWKDNVIENRTQIYEQMKEALDLDPIFFVRNAAEAKWNKDKKYFNLVSGKHRCTFLTAMNKKYIPLKIKKADYEQFFHASEVDRTLHFIRSSKRGGMQVPHPAFYRGVFVRDRGKYQILMWFAQYFGRKMYEEKGRISFEALKILDLSNDHGHFARFCERLGCQVERGILPNTLERQLNRLFYSNNIDYTSKENLKNKDIIVIDGKTDGTLEEEIVAALVDLDGMLLVKYVSDDMLRKLLERGTLTVESIISRKNQNDLILKSYLMRGYSSNA